MLLTSQSKLQPRSEDLCGATLVVGSLQSCSLVNVNLHSGEARKVFLNVTYTGPERYKQYRRL